MGSISAREAQQAHKGQLKWANMLRPDYCEKGRYFAGVAFPVFYIKEADGMTKIELLYELQELGAHISYPTLNRYVIAGLVTSPVNVNRGRGKGQISQYPTRALYEAFAAWSLLNGTYRTNKAFLQKLLKGVIEFQEVGPWHEMAWEPWLYNVFAAYFFHRLEMPVPEEGKIVFVGSEIPPELYEGVEYCIAKDRNRDYNFVLLRRGEAEWEPIITAKTTDVFTE